MGKILQSGSAGFFQGFCLFGMGRSAIQNNELSGNAIGGFIGSSAIGGATLLMLYNNNDISTLLPYTVGLMSGVISSALFLNTLESLVPVAATCPGPKI